MVNYDKGMNKQFAWPYKTMSAVNWGEFVHSWRGAAGVNFKEQAIQAFGWTNEWEDQFKQAQLDFPIVKYK